MRRRTCHGLSRSFGEPPLGTSNTKSRPRRWLDRPSPLGRPRRLTTTTALAPAGRPVACTGSLTSLSKVRKEAGETHRMFDFNCSAAQLVALLSANWEPSSKTGAIKAVNLIRVSAHIRASGCCFHPSCFLNLFCSSS